MSLKINIENYEAYYLDFLEGNLNEVDMFEFSDFLKQHPELKIEEDILDFKLVPTEKLDKSYLNELKVFDESESICENNYENFMISHIEKQLNSSKEIELQNFISKNKIYEHEFNLYQKSKLQPNLNEVFEDKKSLKQSVVIPLYYKIIATAATIILALLLIPFSKNSFHEIGSSAHVFIKI
jgi:6-pyruvoyl-tetrahydropterin synthase